MACDQLRGEVWDINHELLYLRRVAGLQVVCMGLIAHVTQTSAMFAHHHYGHSFIFSNVSWVLSGALALGVILYARYGAQGYIALE